MEWRCENCGEPHRRNEPPCRECGHMHFERSVIRLEYQCETCGEPAMTDEEPCERCDGESFTRLRDPVVDPEPELDDEVRVREHAREQQLGDDIVWDCRNCGNRHMRNSPPCDRCGHPTLEKVILDDEMEIDVGSRSRLDSVLGTGGLALAAVGGLVMLYGGLTGDRTVTGQLAQSARLLIFAGFLVLAVGAALIFLTTRRSTGQDI